MSERQKRILFSAAVIGLFIFVNEIRRVLFQFEPFLALYDNYPSEFPTILWKTLQIILCILAVMAIQRKGLVFAFEELGLRKSPLLGLGVTFLATAPMLAVLLIFSPLNSELTVAAFLMSALASPFSEEMLFRGFLFGQLYLRAKWPFIAAALMNALPFIYGHLYQTDGSLLQTAGVVLVMGIGGIFFAWIWMKWDYNLWVIISYHAFANGWFALFSPGESAVGNWFAFAVVAIGAAGMLVVTLNRERLERFILGHMMLLNSVDSSK